MSENYTEIYLNTLTKSQLKTICLLWSDGLGINYETTTEENLKKFIIDCIE